MFLIECGKRHIINYNDFCCLQHLIEMNFLAESQTLGHKFGKSMLKCLNHHFRTKKLNFESLKLDTAKHFLDIVTKYSSHFYFLNKFDYSKILVRIGLKAAEETSFKEHSEIILRKCAIYNNVACVYEKTGAYSKAIKYCKVYLKYANSRYDKLVVLNNMARIYVKINDLNSAAITMKSLYTLLKEEAKRLLSEHLKNARETLPESLNNQGENLNRVNLVSFLYYNYATFLENSGKEQEAIEKFRKGYEFTLPILGEYNIIIQKFAFKLYSKEMGTSKKLNYNINKKDHHLQKESSDEEACSEYENMSIEENLNFKPKVSQNNKVYYEETQKKTQRLETFNTFKMVSKKNTLSTGQNLNLLNQNFNTIQNNEMLELRQKVDILLLKLDKLDIEKINKFMDKESDSSFIMNTQEAIKENKNYYQQRKDKIIKLFKPAIKKYLIKAKDKNNLVKGLSLVNDQSDLNRKNTMNISQDFLNDLVSQFEAEMREESSLHTNSDNQGDEKIKNKNRRNTEIGVVSRSKSSAAIKNQSSPNILNIQNLRAGERIEKESEPSENVVKARRSLRDIFKKVIPEKTVQNLENYNPSNRKGSFFTDMIESLLDDKSSANNLSSPKTVISKNISNKTSVSSQSNNIQIKSNIKAPTISIQEDNSNDKYEFTTLVYKNESQKGNHYKKQVNNFAKGFKINIIRDNSENEYKYQPFYMKATGDRTIQNKVIPSNNYGINICMEQSNNDDFKAETLFFKSEEKNQQKNEENTITLTKNSTPILKEINLDSIDDDNINQNSFQNLLKNKIKKFTDIKKHFDLLLKECKISDKIFSIIRELNNDLYKIAISYGSKDVSKGIFLRLRKLGPANCKISDRVVAENFISFEKLKSFATKITLFNSLPEYIDLHMLLSLDDFIEKVFIYHCYIFAKEGNILLGVLTRPLGICFNRAYEFIFLKTSCIIDIFIMNSKEVKFFIYNKAKYIFNNYVVI
jgi:hypothetical protein